MGGGFEVLAERGFIKQCTSEDLLKEYLDTETVTFYCGFDPTGPSLHAGHMIPLFAMAHLQRAGHRAIPLVGGGTARIGDPSGKTEMRKILTYEQIKANARAIGRQIGRFIDFSNDRAVMLDNADWLADLNYIDFLRDIGRHFSVNRMLSFETYKMRLETGLSFIEFNYQLLQSYDFLVLYQREGCKLQIGGDDQWGNIVAGADLTRRVEGAEVIGLTFPLVARADGKKMGKSEAGAVFLDPQRVTPYDFFQYWRNVPDADVRKFLRLYTFLTIEEIDEIMAGIDGADGPSGDAASSDAASTDAAAINAAKERLATEITALVHSWPEAKKARDAARALFAGGGGAGGNPDAMPSGELDAADLEAGIPVLELFQRAGLSASKSEARRLVQQGGARINDTKVSDIEAVIDGSWAAGPGEDDAASATLILRAGKKRYFRFLVT